MEMYQVRYFLSVARALNFTRAAEDCDVAQPSLSRAIKQLEAELGDELFRRERPQAILTELGHRMLPILTRCFESASAARALAAGIGKGGAAMRVALSPSIDLGLVLSSLCEVRALFDGVDLVVRRETAAGTLDLLKAGEVEVAVAAEGNLNVPQWLERFPLFDRGICARLAPASIGWRTAQASASTTFGKSASCFRGTRNIVTRLPRRCGAEDDMTPGRTPDMAALVAAGVGVAIAPRSFPRSDMLAAMPVEGLDLRRTVSVFGAASRPRSTAAVTLINLLRATDWGAVMA